MKIEKWRNSLYVRMPAPVVDALNLKAGDEIEIQVIDTSAICYVPAARAHLVSLRKYRGRLPSDFKFDRFEANAR